MARRHPDMPSPEPVVIRKTQLLKWLRRLDGSRRARERVVAMETEFRNGITSHVGTLKLLKDAPFAKFNTNPFVLLFHTRHRGYKRVREIEDDILPAKIFASMETSAGRMVETVVLPVYGWKTAPSKMHSSKSVIDGQKKGEGVLRLVTLKSGPRCLNDPTTASIVNEITENVVAWARQADVKEVDFTYGVLYGTKKKSNKKDWHILRRIAEKLPDALTAHPKNCWYCAFEKDGISVNVTIRIGIEFWSHFSGQQTAFLEMACALIRACDALPTDVLSQPKEFTIADLGEIIALDIVPPQFNVGILQRSQLEWLFFFASHFCDQLENT